MKYALLILTVICLMLLSDLSVCAQKITPNPKNEITTQEAAELLGIDDFFIEKAYRIGDIIWLFYCNDDMRAVNIPANEKQKKSNSDDSENYSSDQSDDNIDYSELDEKIKKAIASKDVNDFRAAADEAMLNYYWQYYPDDKDFYRSGTIVDVKIALLLAEMTNIDNSFEIFTDLIYLEAQKGVYIISSEIQDLYGYVNNHKNTKSAAISFLETLLNDPSININTLRENKNSINEFIEKLEKI